MKIIKCRICGEPFFPLVNYDNYTSSDFMYDYGACDKCNKEALNNSMKHNDVITNKDY